MSYHSHDLSKTIVEQESLKGDARADASFKDLGDVDGVDGLVASSGVHGQDGMLGMDGKDPSVTNCMWYISRLAKLAIAFEVMRSEASKADSVAFKTKIASSILTK